MADFNFVDGKVVKKDGKLILQMPTFRTEIEETENGWSGSMWIRDNPNSITETEMNSPGELLFELMRGMEMYLHAEFGSMLILMSAGLGRDRNTMGDR